MSRLSPPLSSAAQGKSTINVARKANICSKVLTEARRLVMLRTFGGPLNALVVRAGELLDDIDEGLIPLRREDNSHHFAIAAILHRELEDLQRAITVQWAKPGLW